MKTDLLGEIDKKVETPFFNWLSELAVIKASQGNDEVRDNDDGNRAQHEKQAWPQGSIASLLKNISNEIRIDHSVLL